jgi:hypothetical protein
MSRTVPMFRTFVLHAERLENDDVWDATLELLRSLEERDGRATVFVHPYTATIAGADIAARIATLLDRGHEIGQHTHFYAWRPDIPAPRKKPPTDLSAENVVRCLDRDREFLLAAGADPQGFTSGGWVMTEAIRPWLARNGFRYDCSVRSFRLPYGNESTAGGEHWTTPSMESGVVSLPTTSTLRGAVRSALLHRPPGASAPGFRYDLAYTHDYDLGSRRPRIASHLLVRMWGEGPWRTAGELTDLVTSPA